MLFCAIDLSSLFRYSCRVGSLLLSAEFFRRPGGVCNLDDDVAVDADDEEVEVDVVEADEGVSARVDVVGRGTLST